MRRAKKAAVVGVAVVIVVAFLFLIPVVSLTADIPNSGGYNTSTATQGNTTRTVVSIITPGYGQGLGSITFCYFGQGALLVNGTYHPMTKVSLHIVGASCPALRAP